MKVDFSKHILEVHTSDFCNIHTIRIPGRSTNLVRFINAGGILAVTGDFGNWIFCREFLPNEKEQADPSYMDGKLEIASEQKAKKYDPQKTEEAIHRRMKQRDCESDEKKYLKEVLEYVHENEMMYTMQAFNSLPRGYDHDTMIIEKSRHYWLDVVYDAFNEICNRLKDEKKETVN